MAALSSAYQPRADSCMARENGEAVGIAEVGTQHRAGLSKRERDSLLRGTGMGGIYTIGKAGRRIIQNNRGGQSSTAGKLLSAPLRCCWRNDLYE